MNLNPFVVTLAMHNRKALKERCIAGRGGCLVAWSRIDCNFKSSALASLYDCIIIMIAAFHCNACGNTTLYSLVCNG